MARVDERPQQEKSTNGSAAVRTIPVENPATAPVIGHVPNLTAEQVAELAAVFPTAKRGEAVARRLESGAVRINDALLNNKARTAKLLTRMSRLLYGRGRRD